MRQETGKYLIRLYDELSSRLTVEEAKTFMTAKEVADEHCRAREGYSAVVLRILYNTKELERH